MSSKNEPPKNEPNIHLRPIDAPDLPPWPGRLKPSPGEEDSATQLITDRHEGVEIRGLSTDDPRELAKRLANEAKTRLMAASPIPQREPQERKEESTMAAEDPRELARRLAEEAKRRMREPTPDVVQSHIAQTPPAGEPAIERPAAERAQASRPMSAMEALAAAREVEKQRAALAQTPAPIAQSATAPQPVAQPAASAHLHDPATNRQISPATTGRPSLSAVAPLIKKLFGDVDVEPAVAVENAEVFRALWRAHGARALHEGDMFLVVTANVLIDAIQRLPPGWLAATRVRIGPAWWAVWVDLDRNIILGVARPADVYLAGL